MSGLKKDVSIYFTANTAVALIPFLLLPLLTRYLGPEGYGVVAMFTTFTTLLGAFTGLNTHNGITTRWFDRDEIDFPKFVASCMAIFLGSVVVIVLLLSAIKQELSSLLSIPVLWLYLAILVSIGAFITQVRLALWQVQEKSLYYGSMQFGQAFLNGLSSFILVVVFLNDFEGRLWGQVLSVTIVGSLSFFLLYKEGFIRFSASREYVKDALSFGVPLIPHVLGAFFLLLADRMIVNAKLGTSSAGIYMIAVQIALGYNLVNESFNKAFIPWLFSRLKKEETAQKILIVKFVYKYFLLLLIPPLLSILFGKYVIAILAGPEFMAAAPVLNWLILMQSFHGMYYLVTSYLFFEGKTHITATITIICGTFNLGLTLYLVDALGLTGAGISSAMSMLLQFLFTWFMAAKVHPMPWFSSQIFQKHTMHNEVL